MTQIEQIKAEIERLTEVTGYALSEYENGRRSAMYDTRQRLIEFINSLPSEQPSEELEGLEDSIIEFLGHVPENDPDHSETLYTYEQMQEIARHFANWQKEQMMKNVVETKVKGRIDGKGIFIDTDIPIGIDVNEDDKVKIIIIKEDEQ